MSDAKVIKAFKASGEQIGQEMPFHQALYGELRICTITVAMPIGDGLQLPHLRSALNEYLEKCELGELGRESSDVFVSMSGAVVSAVSQFPICEFEEFSRAQERKGT